MVACGRRGLATGLAVVLCSWALASSPRPVGAAKKGAFGNMKEGETINLKPEEHEEDLHTGDLTSIAAFEFERRVLDMQYPVIIVFREGLDEGDAVAEKMSSMAHVYTVSAKTEKTLLTKGLMKRHDPAYPFRLYAQGEKRDRDPVDYASGAEVVKRLQKKATDTFITQLQPSCKGLELFMDHSLDNELLPSLLFTAKEEPPPLIQKMAMMLSSKFSFGVISQPSEACMAKFDVPRLPTLRIYQPTGFKPDGTRQFRHFAYKKRRYGAMSVDTIGRFYAETIRDIVGEGEARKEREQREEDDVLADYEPREVVQLTPLNYRDECGVGAKGTHYVCVIGMFDGAPFEEEQRQKYLYLLEDVQERLLSPQLRFYWVDAACHSKMYTTMDEFTGALPSLVAVSPAKKQFARYLGGFDAESVAHFLSYVLSGVQRTTAFDKFPAMRKKSCQAVHQKRADEMAAAAGPPADGGDAAEDDEVMKEFLQELPGRQAMEEEARAEAEAAAAAAAAAEEAAAATDKKKKKKKKRGNKKNVKEEL